MKKKKKRQLLACHSHTLSQRFNKRIATEDRSFNSAYDNVVAIASIQHYSTLSALFETPRVQIVTNKKWEQQNNNGEDVPSVQIRW